jgi:hypothetical protein
MLIREADLEVVEEWKWRACGTAAIGIGSEMA